MKAIQMPTPVVERTKLGIVGRWPGPWSPSATSPESNDPPSQELKPYPGGVERPAVSAARSEDPPMAGPPGRGPDEPVPEPPTAEPAGVDPPVEEEPVDAPSLVGMPLPLPG
jgi:hypothetical protein